MYSYIKGTVTEIYKDSITLENNNIGYLIYTPNPYNYKMNSEDIAYIYQYVKEDLNVLYGFKTKEEKELFLKLISVSGIGPKSAIAILATGSVTGIINAIDSGNVDYLRKFPGIGLKSSQQIILDLQGKLDFCLNNVSSTSLNELEEALKSLGYKPAEIKKVLPKLDGTKSTSDLIKDALKLILKQ